MKLSTRARYALRMMIEIARRLDNGSTPLGDVAKKTGISRRYLDQLALNLKAAALLTSRKGKGGGYRLTRRPSDIPLRAIIEATIGPINIVECVGEPETCIKAEFCECRSVYALINGRIQGVLDEITLDDLAQRRLGHVAGTLEMESPGCPAR